MEQKLFFFKLSNSARTFFGLKLFWPKAYLAQTFSNRAYPATCVSSELLRVCLSTSAIHIREDIKYYFANFVRKGGELTTQTGRRSLCKYIKAEKPFEIVLYVILHAPRLRTEQLHSPHLRSVPILVRKTPFFYRLHKVMGSETELNIWSESSCLHADCRLLRCPGQRRCAATSWYSNGRTASWGNIYWPDRLWTTWLTHSCWAIGKDRASERGKTYQNKLNLHLGWNCNLEIPIKHPAWCGVVNVKTGLGCTWLAGWPPNPACPVASSPASRIKGYWPGLQQRQDVDNYIHNYDQVIMSKWWTLSL